MKALIVDDSRAMRMLLARILREIGFEVVEAGHGREALERLKAEARPDVVLVDWNMPEMDGLTFVQTVRTERVYDGVRIMMVTTETEPTNVTTALEAGANEYLMKPFTKEAVREKLELLGVGLG